MNEENMDGGRGTEDLTDGERQALRGLPREMIPPAGLEERVTRALAAEGLLRAPLPRPQGRAPLHRLRWTAWAAVAAAGLALFASGMVVGQWNATRGIAEAVVRAHPDDPVAQAAEVQQAGSNYVRAVARLADLAAHGDDRAVVPGREAASAALHAAALELARLSPDDATLRLVLAVLEDRMRSSGTSDDGTQHKTFWF